MMIVSSTSFTNILIGVYKWDLQDLKMIIFIFKVITLYLLKAYHPYDEI